MSVSPELPGQAPVTELEELDRKHVIHAHHPSDRDQRHIMVRGKGSTVWDMQGNEYIDAMGAVNWTAQVGHGRSELVDAAAKQMADLAYFTAFEIYSHEPLIRLAARLAGLAPEGVNRVFFTNGGSEGTDTAIKAARLYHFRRGEPDRTWVISRQLAYHGCTYGSGAATGFEDVHNGFGPHMPNVEKITPPFPYHPEMYDGQDVTDYLVNELEETIKRIGPGNIAAMIGEPVMGGAGMVPPPADYWPRVREVLRANGILLIADEVVTAYGRTGSWFASEGLGMDADLIVTSKGITSGYVPLGAVYIRDEIGDVIGGEGNGFFTGHTYFGHPVACAVALANLDIIEGEGLVDRAKEIGEWFREDLAPVLDSPYVGELRVAGATVGIELVADKESRQGLMTAAGNITNALRYEYGVILRNMGPTIVTAPPLVIEREQVRRVAEAIVDVISRINPDETLSPR